MKLVPFGEVLAEPLRNGVYKRKELHGSGVPVINMKELFAYERVGDQVSDWVELGASELTRAGLEIGDLLFARRSFVLEGAGKCSIVASLPEPTTFESSMIRARLDRTQALPGFFFYFFKSPHGRAAMASIATRTAVSGITGKSLAALPVPVPSLRTQRKVVSVLSAYDDLIENNRRRIRLLEEIAQRIYREWFVELRYPGYQERSASDGRADEMPPGWAQQPLEEILAFHIGGGWGKELPDVTHHRAAAVIRGTDLPRVQRMEIGTCPRRFHSDGNLAKRLLLPGDVILEVSGGGSDQPVGRALLYSEDHAKAFGKDVLCASFSKLLRTKVEVLIPELLYFHFWHIYDTREIETFQVQSTGIKNLRFRQLLEGDVLLVPPAAIQLQFLEVVGLYMKLARSLGAENEQLRRARDLLLPRLVSGDIVLDDLDIPIAEAVA